MNTKDSLRRFIFYSHLVFSLALLIIAYGCAPFNPDEKPDTADINKEIEKKWTTIKRSDVSTWVDYSPSLDTRSEINFVKGRVTIEAIVPVKTKDIKKAGEKQIAQQVKKVFLSGVRLGSLVLKDQLQNKDGKIVTPENLDSFIIKEILPAIRIEKKPYTPKDNIKRIKAYSQVNLVKKHAQIRANQYSGIVKKYSKKYNLAPQLVLALIHKESYFNPFAKSYDGALGLMQLMPEHGAKEAYHYLFKKDIILPENYLFDPENNIELGTAYYYMLKTKYFNKFQNTLKNQYLSVCAYNWGPSRVTRLIKKHDINKMTSKQLYSLLKKSIPRETREYLRDVIILSEKYQKLI